MKSTYLILFLFIFSCVNNDTVEKKEALIIKQNWKLTASFPKSLNSFWQSIDGLSNRINNLTNKEIALRTYQPGELVPALEVFDAVSQGSVEMGVSAGIYYSGKNKSLILESGIPFGLTPRQQNAWLYEYGGLKLIQELYEQYNIKYFPVGNTGAQMGGWFKEEINSIDDLKGKRIRAAGLAGKIYNKMGATIQMVGGGDIYSALEQGTIDGAEFSGPYDDEKFGFQEIAEYYYAPGWGEPGTAVALYINLDKWNSLTQHSQSIIEIAAKESNINMLAKYDKENAVALVRLKNKGVKLRVFDNDILSTAKMYSEEILSDYAKEKDFEKIYNSIKEFKNISSTWVKSNELKLLQFESK